MKAVLRVGPFHVDLDPAIGVQLRVDDLSAVVQGEKWVHQGKQLLFCPTGWALFYAALALPSQGAGVLLSHPICQLNKFLLQHICIGDAFEYDFVSGGSSRCDGHIVIAKDFSAQAV